MRSILIVIFSFLLCFSLKGELNEKNVLVLHSYHQGLEWTDSISAGILSVFNKYRNYSVHFEYLDTKRNYSNEYFQKLLELYKVKAQAIKFDVVIACDNDAFNFLKDYDSLFYRNIPVVFGGVNDFNYAEIQNKKMFYGFAEKADHLGTIQSIKEFFPNKNKILVIGDNTITGEKIRKEVQDCAANLHNGLSLEYFYNFNVEELISKVSHLDDSTAIYLLVINRDNKGKYVSYNQGLKLIYTNTKAPIFSSWDFYFGKGIVGGKITKGFDQGLAMANLALQIITNGVSKQMPRGESVIDKYYFDYYELTHFGLSNKTYPNAIIINQPIEKHKLDKWLLILISILTSVILILLLVMYFRRKYMQTLKKNVEEKTLELQLANNQLLILNNEKNKFLSIAAHDLRSPIGNIRNITDLILEYQYDDLSSQHVRYLEIIKRTSSYMLQLVTNLLDFSIIESGKLKIEREQVFYFDLVNQIVEEISDIASLKSITIELKYDVSKNPMINIDSYRIKQVFNNIIGNAIKFSYPNSTIIVEISIDELFIITSIEDKGKGIPEKELELIFKEFEKGTSKPTNSEKGTGLGLAIAKRIIEAHEGSISVSSQLNIGSIFTFKLPVN